VTRPIQSTLASPEQIIIVSDASVIQGRATWSFIIADLNGNMIAEKTAKVRGEGISSFRAELSGVYAALQECKKINPDTLIKVFCDNKSVIARLTTIQTRKPSTMWSDYDLLQGCYKLLTRKFVFEHVRGHQDTISSNNNLTLQAKLNILMDKRAALAHSDPIILTEETTTSTIEINGKILTGRLTGSLRHEINTQRIETYYKRKFGPFYEEVLWDVFFMALSKFKRIPVGIHKMIHNISPTQQVQYQRGITQDDSCFFCNEEIESLHHVVTCKSRDMEGKNLFLQDVRGSLKIKDSKHDALLSTIYERIFLIQCVPDWPIQASIGWHRCLRGYFSKEWLDFVSEIKIKNKENQHVLSAIIVSAWKIWNLSWRRRNEDIDINSRYSTQSQDHTNTININTIYECYTIMGKRSDGRLMQDAQSHLKEDRLKIINWLTLHLDTLKEEINAYDSNLWSQIETKIRSQSFLM
jgi:ribonuclease HI